MEKKINDYINSLSNSYDMVSYDFFLRKDFEKNNLEKSIKLFTDESIKQKKPQPKKLNVYALLSGISFEDELKSKLYDIQIKLKKIVNNNLAYFVRPENFGLEHCVFKWPNENWDNKKEQAINKLLDLYNFEPFNININGIQIHNDGCIIAKGYVPSRKMEFIREYFKKNLKFFPTKQSIWSHIPLGRILEPIGEKKYKLLKDFVKSHNKLNIFSTKIKSYKFINEKRWYMEEKEILRLIKV